MSRNCSECQKQFMYTTCSPQVLSLRFSCIELVIQWTICSCKNKSFWQRFTCTGRIFKEFYKINSPLKIGLEIINHEFDHQKALWTNWYTCPEQGFYNASHISIYSDLLLHSCWHLTGAVLRKMTLLNN